MSARVKPAERYVSLLLGVWIVLLCAGLAGLAYAEAAVTGYTLEALTTHGGAGGRLAVHIRYWHYSDEYAMLMSYVLSASFGLGLGGAIVAVVVFPHWRRWGYAVLALGVPAGVALAMSAFWYQQAPHLVRWGMPIISGHMVAQMLGGLSGVFGGRPLARLLTRLVLPPRLRGAVAFLWTVDGKNPPVVPAEAALTVDRPGPTSSYPASYRAVAIAAIALVVISLLSLSARRGTAVATLPMSEDGYYSLSVARNLALGNGLTIDGRTWTNGFQPLFTLLCSPVYMLCGGDRYESLRGILLLHTAIHVATAFVVASLACGGLRSASRRLCFWLIALLYLGAAWLMNRHHNGLETGLLLLLYALLWLYYERIGIETNARCFVFAIGLGLIVLTRVDTVFLVIIISFAQLLGPGDWRCRLQRFMVLSATSLALSSPWWLYNLLCFGDLVPSSGISQQVVSFSPRRIVVMAQALLVNVTPSFYFDGEGLATAFFRLVFLAFVLIVTLRLGWSQWPAGDRGRRLRRFGVYLGVSLAVLVAWYISSIQSWWFYGRYTSFLSLVVVVLFGGVLAGLVERAPRLAIGVVMLLALPTPAVIAGRHLQYLQRDHGFYYEQLRLAMDRIPADAVVAGGQSGTLGYFRDRVVNCDGKVNFEVNPYNSSGRLREYLDMKGINWFCDVRFFDARTPEVIGWREMGSLGQFKLFARVSGLGQGSGPKVSLPFFFIQIADPQFGFYASDNNEVMETMLFGKAVDEANRLRPAFVVVTGDIVSTEGNDREAEAALAIARKLSPDIPIRWVPGNHDVSPVPDDDHLKWYCSRFGPDWYSFEAGDCLFIVLNSSLIERPENAPAQSKKQADWLRGLLAEKKNHPYKHRIVFQHHPYFSRIPADRDGIAACDAGQEILDLLVEHKVDAVFAGHRHSNRLGRSGPLEMVTTSSLGRPFGTDPNGLRIVRLYGDHIEHEYYGLDEVPPRMVLDQRYRIRLDAHDPDGDALVYEIVSKPRYGTLQGLPPNLSYIPHPDWAKEIPGDAVFVDLTLPAVKVVNYDPESRVAGVGTCVAYRSLRDAAEAARPGQTVVLREGRYQEPLVPGRSGEPGRPITFRNYGLVDQVIYKASDGKLDSTPATVTVRLGEEAVITDAHPDATVTRGVPDWVILDGLKIDGASNWLREFQSRHNIVRNCTFPETGSGNSAPADQLR